MCVCVCVCVCVGARAVARFGVKVENPKDFKKYTNNILEYVDDIKNIVSSFVYFARLPQPSFQMCLLGKWLSGIVDVRRNTRPNISYIFRNLVLEEVSVTCDLNQMSQVLNNLLTNSEESLFDNKKEPIIEIFLCVFAMSRRYSVGCHIHVQSRSQTQRTPMQRRRAVSRNIPCRPRERLPPLSSRGEGG